MIYRDILYKIFDAIFAAVLAEGGDGTAIIIVRREYGNFPSVKAWFGQYLKDNNINWKYEDFSDIDREEFTISDGQQNITVTNRSRECFKKQEKLFDFIWETI